MSSLTFQWRRSAGPFALLAFSTEVYVFKATHMTSLIIQRKWNSQLGVENWQQNLET